jgi:hypothetical protein
VLPREEEYLTHIRMREREILLCTYVSDGLSACSNLVQVSRWTAAGACMARTAEPTVTLNNSQQYVQYVICLDQ